MTDPGNYLDDRSTPKDVIYVEDSKDWVATWGFPDIVKNGLNRSVGWYGRVDDALLSIVKNESFQEAEQYVKAREDKYREQPTPDEIAAVTRFIDPERLKNKIIVLDNEVPGWLFGMDLIEAVINVSQHMSDEEKPKIVSLMCSNPEVVEGQRDIVERWNTQRIEVIHKEHYPFFVFWMGQALKGEKTRFRDWFRKISGVDYNSRINEARKIQPLVDKLTRIVDYIRDDEAEEHRGILSRITDKEILGIFQEEPRNYAEVPALLDQWNQAAGQPEREPRSVHVER